MSSSTAAPPARLSGCVALETSLGPVVVGLFGHDCPKTCANFVSLCRMGFYHGTYVRRVVRGQFAEIHPHEEVGHVTARGVATGDPGDSIPLELQNQLRGVTSPSGEVVTSRRLRLDREGLLVMLPADDPGVASSAFAVTLVTTKNVDFLERKCTIFGIVLDGMSVLRKLNASSLVDAATGAANVGVADGRPVTITRIKRTHVIDTGAFVGAETVSLPEGVSMTGYVKTQRLRRSISGAPLPPAAIRLDGGDSGDGQPIYNDDETFGMLASDAEEDGALYHDATAAAASGPMLSRKAAAARQQASAAPEVLAFRAALEQAQRARVDRTRSLMLQLLGELPDDGSNAAPPENVLFVCKLNPYTKSEDLAAVFQNNFGKVKECEVVKDRKTGQSLQYAFVEFENVGDCQRAYLKMDNVVIDDSRIHVDFSQSVAGVWRKQQQAKRQRSPQQQRDVAGRDVNSRPRQPPAAGN